MHNEGKIIYSNQLELQPMRKATGLGKIGMHLRERVPHGNANTQDWVDSYTVRAANMTIQAHVSCKILNDQAEAKLAGVAANTFIRYDP